MAEIRINATGGVKLYDADDSHYAQIIAGTITSNVDALTLGHASADFNIPVKVIGTTPTLTIGDAGAEDTKIVFDGNAQDFYIALDDSADDLLIGLGSTVGTTPAIAIDENLKVNIPVTTASTSASTGSLTTGGGAGIGADLYVGDDTYLITDSAVLGFGADKDTLLTHTDGTGLTLNSTNKLCFNDASQFVQGSSATVLSIGATDEIDLTATAIDINGTCDISGTFSLGGTNMTATAAELNLLDGGTSVGSSITIADADGFVVNDGGTMKTIPATDIPTYVGGGITMCDSVIKSANVTISADTSTVVTGWAQMDAVDGSGSIGSAMTVSSGVFTFPATGYYYIDFAFQCSGTGANDQAVIYLETTVDNSTYTDACDPSSFFADTGDHIGLASSFIFDVTDTANRKMRFTAYSVGVDMTLGGDGGRLRSGFQVIRLGDT